MPTNTKRCCTCKKPKSLEKFYRLRSSPDGRFSSCIICYRKQREPQKKRINENRREWEWQIKKEALRRYGRKCGCCGESEFEFLTVVPRDSKKMEISVPYQLKRQGFPRGYRVLCYNCREAMRRFGRCPHQEASI